jgi:NAD-dependent dihydropyrimidine dehydrogenase PreA subunit
MTLLDLLRYDLPLTLLRVLPWRAPTGLGRVGAPGPTSPVLLTGNYRLTVERVRRALAGRDVWLLVANSRGINVWCAATGGLLTDHDVISVLKTSGIGRLVHHRRVILPQLAATGIVGPHVRDRTGWTVVWGPVDAASIPAYLAAGRSEGRDAARTVGFPWPERLEMAVAWAFPISLLALLVWPVWPGGVLPLVALVWGFALALFLGFPLYQPWLRTTRRHRGLVLFDWGERGLPVGLWLLFVAALSIGAAAGVLAWALVFRWGAASIVVLLLIGLDLAGSTPVFKSGLHADRLLRVVLDEQRCKGAGFCEQVCPTDVFSVDHERHLAALPHAERCVQCGACIVQCPFDALSFQDPDGAVVAPATVRRFKLNLLGQRVVPRGPGGAAM